VEGLAGVEVEDSGVQRAVAVVVGESGIQAVAVGDLGTQEAWAAEDAVGLAYP
jgi:hypothetical protein